MTTVSLVITTFNHARYLGEAIDSALRQTRRPDEIIVVDDGSADDPDAVVTRYSQVRLIRQRNQGLSAARNTGLAAAAGEFIAFLDADDRLSPIMVERTLEALTTHPDCAFAYGAYALIDEAGAMLQTSPLQAPGRDAYASFLRGNIIGMHGTVLYRRALLAEAGGFDSTLRACEDYDLYLRLSHRYGVIAVDAVLADYRRHRTNMSSVSPFMLGWVLAALAKQRETSAQRPDWAHAYREGVAGWRSFYAGAQVQTLASSVRSGRDVGRQIKTSLAMLRLAPGPMAAGVATKVAEVTRPRRRARSLVRRVRFAAGVERPIVLMYHRVATPSVDPWNLSVSPARFSEQLAILARARRVVPMHWLAARLAEGKLPRHTAAITFDDGYADFLLAALPILREHGCPATLFLTTGAVGRADGYWWDHLARLTLQAPHLPPFLDLTIGAARLAIPVAAGPAGRRALLDRLAEVFRTTPGDACWAALDALRAWANVAPDAPEADRALTADEVRSLAADPLVEIGAHTVTHPSMPSLDPQRAQWEAAESRRACEALIGRSIAGFSYPFGDHHAASVAAVRQAGLAYACTVEARPLHAASPLFALPRIAVHDWDGATFRSEILTHG